MNNAKVIEAIDHVITGLVILKSELELGEKTTEEKSVTPVVEAEVEIPSTEFNEKELRAMKYNEFKKLAASLGVKCTGTRDEIMERILSLNSGEVAEEEQEESEVTENTETVEEAVAEVEEETAETEEVDFEALAKSILDETEVSDVIEALSEVGVKATKRNVVAKLSEALEKGLIELSDEAVPFEESAEEVEESEETESNEEVEITDEDYYSEFDPDGLNNPEEMTSKRAKAVKKLMNEIIDSLEDDKTFDEMKSFIDDYATEDETDGLDLNDEETLFKLYTEMSKRFIDNDGKEHEASDPYEVGEHLMCCGHELKYVAKTKRYICEICGEEYEAE